MTPETETVDLAASGEAPRSEAKSESDSHPEPAVATDTSATPGAPDSDPLAGSDPGPAPTDPEDAEILASVDTAIAKGGPEPVAEPYEPPAEHRTPTDAAEDAEILASVDAAVEADRLEDKPAPEPEPEPSEAPPSEPPAPRSEPVAAPAAASSGGSLAGWLLAALLLLLVGGGLALWAAPKLAPQLPAGIAAWVSPADPEVAALKGEFDGLKSQVSELGGGVQTQINAATADVATRLDGEIAALKTELGTTDTTSLRQRLDRVEATVQGQTAELGTLKDQLTGATGTGTAQIDVYRGELDGLRAEMGALSDKVAALATRVDEVGAEASRQIDTAQAKVAEVQQQASTATLQADLAEIQAAMAAGQPFAAPLDRLASAPGVSVPEPLKAAASAGIPSMSQLRDSFPNAAHQAIRASILAGGGTGLVDRAGAFLRAEVATRSLTPQPGRSPDAVLSRMEDKLRNDDLAGALAESSQLPSEALAAMSSWLDAARLRAGAEAGLSTLSAAVPATN